MRDNHSIPKREESKEKNLYRKLINHYTKEQENTKYEINKRYRKIKQQNYNQ